MGLRLDNGRTSRQNNRRAMLRDLELTACSRARLGNTQFPSAGAATIQGVSMGLRLDNGRKSRQNNRRAMLRDLELTACSRARLGNTQFPSAGATTI